MKMNLYLMMLIQEIIYLKQKNEIFIINFDEYEWIGTHWITLYVHVSKLRYFDSFGAEHIPKEI